MISELLNNGMSRGKMFLILKTLVHCLLHFPGKKQPYYQNITALEIQNRAKEILDISNASILYYEHTSDA